MRILVNSTPLIGLCKIGKLDILRAVYGEVVIPQAVYDEVTVKGDTVCAQINVSLDWIRVEKIGNKADRKLYSTRLHAGEVEVMILAREVPRADLVIIDDNAAKKTAKFLGLNVTGTIGVLLEAKAQGIITSIAPHIEELKRNGVFISDAVIQMALRAANEL